MVRWNNDFSYFHFEFDRMRPLTENVASLRHSVIPARRYCHGRYVAHGVHRTLCKSVSRGRILHGKSTVVNNCNTGRSGTYAFFYYTPVFSVCTPPRHFVRPYNVNRTTFTTIARCISRFWYVSATFEHRTHAHTSRTYNNKLRSDFRVRFFFLLLLFHVRQIGSKRDFYTVQHAIRIFGPSFCLPNVIYTVCFCFVRARVESSRRYCFDARRGGAHGTRARRRRRVIGPKAKVAASPWVAASDRTTYRRAS